MTAFASDTSGGAGASSARGTSRAPHGWAPAWVVAFAFAAALHAGALGVLWWKAQTEDDSTALGAPAIEVSLELAAPRQEADDLPIGPAADESAASAAAVEQHEKVEKVEAPKEQPKEAPDAERVVAPEVSKEQKDEPSKVETKAQTATESVASEAAAPPKIETAKEAAKSTAPSPGTGVSAERVLMAWQKKLVAHINQHKRYPASDTRKTVQLTVTFTLDRLGRVVDAKVQSSSGDPLFDQAALAMMHRADPVPPPPPLVADQGLTFSIPVIFQRKHG